MSSTIEIFGSTFLAPMGLALGGAAVGFYLEARNKREQAKLTRAEIEHAESLAAQQPERAKLAWDLARITLEAYFTRNLSQINSIFWLSVAVMVVGFALLTWGVSQALSNPSAVIPASLTVGAGVITEFIGATFLFIYRSTIQQAISYSQTLERINSVGMAMQILDTMPESVPEHDLRSKTKASLVELLVRQAHGTSNAEITKTKTGRFQQRSPAVAKRNEEQRT
jgi:hypothetical protein